MIIRPDGIGAIAEFNLEVHHPGIRFLLEFESKTSYEAVVYTPLCFIRKSTRAGLPCHFFRLELSGGNLMVLLPDERRRLRY